MLLEPVWSVVKFSFYPEMARKSVARAIGYIAYLGLLFSIAATLALHLILAPAMREATDWITANMPTLTFADGKVTSTLTAPLVLRHPKAPDFALFIDTNRTAPLTLAEMTDQKLFGALTQNTLYLRAKPEELRQYDLSRARSPKPVSLDANMLRAAAGALPKYLYPSIFIFCWIFFFCWRLAAGLAYSLVGIVISAATSAELSYDALYKITLYAQTPIICLDAVMMFAPFQISTLRSLVIAWLIMGVYTWQAVRQLHPPAAPAA